MKLTKENIKSFMNAKSTSEILSIAKQSHIEMDEKEATYLYDMAQASSNQISDLELDEVTGGTGNEVTSWECPICKKVFYSSNEYFIDISQHISDMFAAREASKK